MERKSTHRPSVRADQRMDIRQEGRKRLALNMSLLWSSGAGAIFAVGLLMLLVGPSAAQTQGYSLLNGLSAAENPSMIRSSELNSPLIQKPDWLGNLTITGFQQNTTGMFLNTQNLEYHHSKSQLVTERNLSQVDFNDSWGEHFQFFGRFWGVYEPAYPFENDATIEANNTHDFYNEYAFRDLWMKSTWGPLTLFTGKQIAEWGESIAFRVGDQINPQDVSYAFGFANLEQSHLPIWMIHPLLHLPPVLKGMLTSNLLEVVYAPGFDFLYNHVDYPDDHMDGQDNVAGRVDIDPSPGARFAGRPEERCEAPESLCIPGPIAGGLPGGGPIVVGPPVSYVLESGQTINEQYEVPRATFANSVVGVRLVTLIAGNLQATAFYLYNHNHAPVLELGPPGKPGTSRRVNLIYPKYQSLGATFNVPAPLPANVLAYAPLIIRGEMFYKNHESISTSDIHETSGLVHSDTLEYMLALDLDSAAPPKWLTTTGTIGANLEFMDTITMDSNSKMLQAPGYLTPLHHNEATALLSIGTSWWWGAIAPNWTGLYDPDGNTLIMFPTITFTPPWTNKYFGKIGYVGISGQNKFAVDAGGTFKGMNYIYMQFQYNFNAL